MKNRPTKKHSIDRIDNNSGYNKKNCRWATQLQQQNNKRNNHLITYDNRTQTLTLWANETGIKRQTITARIKRNWSIENVLTIPVGKKIKT